MTDQITVNVDVLRTALRSHLSSESRRLRAALAAHDKAEQEHLGTLVLVREPDTGPMYTGEFRGKYEDWWCEWHDEGWYELTPEAVESLGEFYLHQTDHACESHCDGPAVLCKRCACPRWAHTPPEPALLEPGWYEFITANEAATTHIAYACEDGSVYLPEGPDVVTGRDFKAASKTARFWRLDRLDPDSITIPKSALGHSVAFVDVAANIRQDADMQERKGNLLTARDLRAIADALEADHA